MTDQQRYDDESVQTEATAALSMADDYEFLNDELIDKTLVYKWNEVVLENPIEVEVTTAELEDRRRNWVITSALQEDLDDENWVDSEEYKFALDVQMAKMLKERAELSLQFQYESDDFTVTSEDDGSVDSLLDLESLAADDELLDVDEMLDDSTTYYDSDNESVCSFLCFDAMVNKAEKDVRAKGALEGWSEQEIQQACREAEDALWRARQEKEKKEIEPFARHTLLCDISVTKIHRESM